MLVILYPPLLIFHQVYSVMQSKRQARQRTSTHIIFSTPIPFIVSPSRNFRIAESYYVEIHLLSCINHKTIGVLQHPARRHLNHNVVYTAVMAGDQMMRAYGYGMSTRSTSKSTVPRHTSYLCHNYLLLSTTVVSTIYFYTTHL